MLWVRIPPRPGALDTTLYGKAFQWLAAARWFSSGTPVSSTNKADCHETTDILLKVALKPSLPSLSMNQTDKNVICSWCLHRIVSAPDKENIKVVYSLILTKYQFNFYILNKTVNYLIIHKFRRNVCIGRWNRSWPIESRLLHL